MKDSIHKYFQIGTIQWMSHPPADYEVLESIKTICCDDYFDVLEVTQMKDEAVRENAGTGSYESMLWRTAKAVGNRTEPE